METDPKTRAIRAAYEALLQAKPHLNINDPRELKVWGAMESTVLAIQSLPPR